ncbi:MAG: hypothetical protein KDB37_18540, partial [Ilumatobacter sp.]|nr:hypothetical protein [Ilumatobacter sp.]
MSGLAPRFGLAEPARLAFSSAIVIFMYTIVIGILNGTDVWEPEHDVLMSHVHSGTLGWVTLGVAAIILLVVSDGRPTSDDEVARVTTMTWALIAAIVLYVLAFLAGDSIFEDRIQRPIFGTMLFVVVIWFLVWFVGRIRRDGGTGAATLGLLLAWISLLVGAVFGVILGLYTANGEVPGLGGETAARVADAHPPAMVIGFLLVAAFSIVEWMLFDDDTGRSGKVQVWLLFVAGIVINIAFVTGTDEQLAGPANLLMIVAAVIMLWRARHLLAPSAWAGAGVGRFPRFALLFLVYYLVLLTILISWIIRDVIDFEVLTESQEGLLLAFDHVMFIGVMTNIMFGVLARYFATSRTDLANRIVQIGVNVGIIGFSVGLFTTTTILKRIFAPIMGVSLLIALTLY